MIQREIMSLQTRYGTLKGENATAEQLAAVEAQITATSNALKLIEGDDKIADMKIAMESIEEPAVSNVKVEVSGITNKLAYVELLTVGYTENVVGVEEGNVFDLGIASPGGAEKSWSDREAAKNVGHDTVPLESTVLGATSEEGVEAVLGGDTDAESVFLAEFVKRFKSHKTTTTAPREGHYFDNIHCHDISICDLQNECVVLETECTEFWIQSEFVRMMIAKINKGRRFTLFPRPHIKDEDNTIYALGSCVACKGVLGLCPCEYEVKEEYTNNHVADKHSKAGHMFDEEMEDAGKCCDVEMHEATTRSFQGMSNEVQSDKLDEDKDTTIRAHERVNDHREESDHEVLPDQQDVDKEHPDKDQQDIDKDQKVEVDDENLLRENKDGDKDPIIQDPKVDTGGNKVLKEEDPKVDTGVSKEPLEECLPADEEVHKAQFLGDKDPL
ncbi:hypothetical protein L7F22_062188 [Adiantum nelumboides]|nr:hypothetical protein [Adiantum nelumboides]